MCSKTAVRSGFVQQLRLPNAVAPTLRIHQNAPRLRARHQRQSRWL
jgi:hypothetical protein